jgi:Lrp/AsnC family transcriptional regulator for asnA, asnC and gidA
MAKQLHSSPATIRRKVKRLIDNNDIRIVARTNPDKIGLLVRSLIGLHVQPSNIDSALRWLSDRPEIMWAASTTGRYDIVFVARFIDSSELTSFIQNDLPKLEGMTGSETFVCFQWFSWGHHLKTMDTPKIK